MITDSNGCSILEEFEISEPPPLSITHIEQEAPSCGKPNGKVILNVDGGKKPYTITWDKGWTGANPQNLTEGNHSAMVIDSNGCSKVYEIRLTGGPENKLHFANSFSPNGDQLNEVYELVGSPECFTNARLVIFNRWGERVFETQSPFTDFWDGTTSGSTTPKIDIYTFHFISDEFSNSGYINIIR